MRHTVESQSHNIPCVRVCYLSSDGVAIGELVLELKIGKQEYSIPKKIIHYRSFQTKKETILTRIQYRTLEGKMVMVLTQRWRSASVDP